MPHEIPDTYSTWLVVPYFNGDLGRAGLERPLPKTSVAWLCPAVKVNGNPLRTFAPGEPTTVDVTVANHGGGTGKAAVTVTVWWADPHAGFANAKWFGAANVAVGSKGQSATATMTGVIPVTAPRHVCLLVAVEAPADPLPATGIAPGAERHWAQLNIDAVAATQASFTVPFSAGNPTGRPVRFHLTARPVRPEAIDAIAGALGTHAYQDTSISLRLTGNGREAEGDAPLIIDLGPGETLRIELSGTIEPPPPPGRATAIEIVQHAPHDIDDVLGALGVMVTSDG